MLYTHWCCCCTANPTWGDILECCFKAQSSKLKGLFSLKRGKRDVRALSFEPLKMSPQVGLAVLLMGCCIINQILVTLWLCVSALSRMTYVTPYTVILPSSFEDDSNHSNPVYNAFPGVSSRLLGSYPVNPSVQCVCVRVYTHIYTHIHKHLSPCSNVYMFRLFCNDSLQSVCSNCNMSLCTCLYRSRQTFTHLRPHVLGSLFQYSYLSMFPMNTHIPCS